MYSDGKRMPGTAGGLHGPRVIFCEEVEDDDE